MARTLKPGIPYYSMDSDHTENSKIKLLINEFDSHGYWIYQCILGRIYKNKGYFMDLNDMDELTLFASDVCKKQVALVMEVIKGCVRRGLFDKTVYDMFNKLTNDRIQSNYIDATRDRRKKGTTVNIIVDFFVIEIPQNEKNFQLLEIKKDNSREKLNNSREEYDFSRVESPQSKVKKSKVNESKEEYARDALFEGSVLNFFGFNETDNPDKKELLSSCCCALQSSGHYESFKTQFQNYSELKTQKGYVHSFSKFLGNAKEDFIDGAWNAENWMKKLSDEINKPKNNVSQKTIQPGKSGFGKLQGGR
jgi:hypothetical protein